jgi:hypothetical protein
MKEFLARYMGLAVRAGGRPVGLGCAEGGVS